MSYVDKNLLPGERVTYRAELHWTFYIPPISWVFCAIVLTLIGTSLRHSGWFGLLCFPAGVLALGGVLGIPVYALAAHQTEFAITNRRIIAKCGVIRRHSLEILLNKVESVRVTQPLLGMIFDYGTVVVSGTGGTHEPFPFIAHPQELRRQVQIRLQPAS